MKTIQVATTLNGDAVEFVCAPDEPLLDVLRNRLGMTGTKEGCGTGDCGACTITLDGRMVCACLVLAAEAEGATITTIEGMSTGDQLHPLQQAFIDHAAREFIDAWRRQHEAGGGAVTVTFEHGGVPERRPSTSSPKPPPLVAVSPPNCDDDGPASVCSRNGHTAIHAVPPLLAMD
jgi:hypothetical protein